MSREELEAEAQRLVQHEQELEKLQAAKKEEVAKRNAEIKMARAAITDSVAKLSSGKEKRQVEVEKRFRYKDDEVDWVRLDTREVIQTLPMDPFDRQESLELDGAKGDLPPPAVKRGRKVGPEYEGDALPPAPALKAKKASKKRGRK